TQASRDAAASRERQARLRLSQARDDVATEVTAAWHRLSAGRRRLEISRERLKQAGESLRLHRLRIRSLVGLPLEAQQAVSAISQARQDRLEAIVDFNRQQVGLLRAIGRPVGGGE
ncbi:MAG: TolC family protein, partial [Planctomycetaceae bacterium]